MQRAFLLGVLLAAVRSAAGDPPPVPAAIPRLPATTGGIGNTLLRGAWSDPQQTYLQLYTSDLAVSPEGFVYLTTTWEEGQRPAGIYKDGDALPGMVKVGVSSGNAVAVGTGLVAYARSQAVKPDGRTLQSIALYRREAGQGVSTNTPARLLPLPEGVGEVTGLALDEARGRVYFADGRQVAALRLRDGKPDPGFAPAPLERSGKMAVDGAGRLWVIQAARGAGVRKQEGKSFGSAPRRGAGKEKDGWLADLTNSLALPFKSEESETGHYGLDFGAPVPISEICFNQGAGDIRFREVRFQGSVKGPEGPWTDLASFEDRPCGWPDEWLTLDPGTPWRCLRIVGPDLMLNKLEAFTPVPASPGRLVCLGADGLLSGPGLDLVARPGDVAYDTMFDRLLVADQGTGSQVHAFTNLAGVLQPDGRFAKGGRLGEPGGWRAGGPADQGRVGAGRFQGIRGVGADAQGNVAVCAVGGRGHGQTTLESYTPGGSLRWRMEGLSFLDTVDADPAQETALFSTVNRVRMDWSATEGNGWAWTASTIDAEQFPDDPRLNGSALLYGMRRIHGKRFLVTTTQHGTPLCVFRFDPERAGETAIPCALIHVRNTGREWPPYQPLGFGPFIWTDRNGDGQFQAGEYGKVTRAEADIQRLQLDDAGGLWLQGTSNRISYLWRVGPGESLDAHGTPGWTWGGKDTAAYRLPPPWDAPKGGRVGGFEVDAESGRVYLLGFPAERPNECGMNYPLGRLMVKCRLEDGRLAVEQTVEIPHNVTLGKRGGDQAFCSALAGDYLFVGYMHSMIVLVYRKTDLALVGRLEAGPQTYPPMFDGPPELVARKLSDGGYALFMPQYMANAVIVLRWNGETTGWLPPPQLEARVAEDRHVEVRWAPVEKATGWIVEQRLCTESGWGEWKKVAEMKADSLSWRDPGPVGLAAGHRVRALGEQGARSDWSATKWVRRGTE